MLAEIFPQKIIWRNSNKGAKQVMVLVIETIYQIRLTEMIQKLCNIKCPWNEWDVLFCQDYSIKLTKHLCHISIHVSRC